MRGEATVALIFDMTNGEILEETPHKSKAPCHETARTLVDIPHPELQIIEAPQPRERQPEMPEALVNADLDSFLDDMDGQSGAH